MPKTSTVIVEEIKAILQKAQASWFTLEDNDTKRLFTFTTRDHGDVGEETPGQADIAAAKRAVPLLRSAYPEAKVEVEAVDEWVHLTVLFPHIPLFCKLEGGEEILKTAFQKALPPVLKAHKINAEEKWEIPPAKKGEKTHAFPSFNFQIGVAFKGILVQRKSSQEITYCCHEKIIFQAFNRVDREYLHIQIGKVSKEQEYKNTIPLAEAIQQLLEKTITELLQIYEIREDLWERVPPPNPLPDKSTIIGHAGYDEPWETSPYYKTPKGDYLFHDGESTEDSAGTWWFIPKLTFKEAIRHLGSDFFPKTPENSLSLPEVTQKILKRIKDDILEEASKGQTTTLEKYGIKGSIIQMEDGSFYLQEETFRLESV